MLPFLKELPYRSKRPAVHGAGTKDLKLPQMIFGPVAFMGLKAVPGIPPVQVLHKPIPKDLGQYRGSGYCRHLVITPWYALAGHRQGGWLIAIYQDELGLKPQLVHRPAHCLQCGLQNVYAINFRGPGQAEGPGQSHILDSLLQLLANSSSKFLGVFALRLKNRFPGQDDRCRHHRTSQAPPPGLVYSSYRRKNKGRHVFCLWSPELFLMSTPCSLAAGISGLDPGRLALQVPQVVDPALADFAPADNLYFFNRRGV